MDQHARGASVEEAAIGGARMRIRPVLMTSLAFVLGLAPLVAMLTRRGVGTAVFGGMIAATAPGVFAVPPLHIVFERLRSLDALCPDMCSSDPPEWHFGSVFRVVSGHPL